MKVVLFCGGLRLRIRDAEDVPKPMVNIGYRPILWHLMKYYSHYGHKDFILCLGHQSEIVKNYFRNYDECTFNDFFDFSIGVNTFRYCRRLDKEQSCAADIYRFLRRGGVCVNIDMNNRFPAFRSHLKHSAEDPSEC